MFTQSRRKGPKQRFSLLCLEEGEYYFDDYICTWMDRTHGKVDGRLRMCSRNLMFDPDDASIAIMRYPLGSVTKVQKLKPPPGQSGEAFAVEAGRTVEMKRDGEDKPYVFKREPVVGRFMLKFEKAEKLVAQIEELVAVASDAGSSYDKAELVQRIVAQREAAMTFDTTWLEDLTERIALETKGERVQPLVSNPGRIVLTESRVYFMPFNASEGVQVLKWSLRGGSGLQRIERRRHNLSNTGVELFFGGKESVFLSFHDAAEREKFFESVSSSCKALSKEPTLGEVMAQWHEGTLSNFEYLMALNSHSGRTVNDLVQYPVFPWVVKDYTSPKLDLTSEDTFRDLSKPIGALEPNRLEGFRMRYQEMPDSPEMPKFMYGTHYSTPGFVLFYTARQAAEYMLRLQSGKFDEAERLFRGMEACWKAVVGSSQDVKELIPEFYDPAASDFLLNQHNIPWGNLQDGTPVHNVKLPPWASDPADFVKQMRGALESEHVSANMHSWIDLIFGYQQSGEEAVKADNVFYHLTYEGAVDIDAITDPDERASILAQIQEFGQCPSQLFATAHPARGSTSEPPELCVMHGHGAAGKAGGGGGRSDGGGATSGGAGAVLSGGTSANVADFSSDFGSAGLSGGRQEAEPVYVAPEPEPEPETEEVYVWGGPGPALGRGWLGGKGAEALKETKTVHIQKALSDLEIAADGSMLYAAYPDACLRMYMLKEGAAGAPQSPTRLARAGSSKSLRQCRSATLGSLALSACSLASDGQVIIVGSLDNHIYLYSMDYGRLIERTLAHDDAVCKLCRRGETLVSASWDSSIKVWKCEKGRLTPVMELVEHDTEVTCLDLDGEGRIAVSGDADGAVLVWNIEDRPGMLLDSLRAHDGSCTAVAWTADSSFLVTTAEDLTLKLYVMKYGPRPEAMLCTDIQVDACIRSLLWIGDSLIAGGDSGTLVVYTLARDAEGGTLQANEGCAMGQTAAHEAGNVTVLTGSEKAGCVLTGADDGSVSLWSL